MRSRLAPTIAFVVALAITAPAVCASPMVQSITPGRLTASQFNADFTATNNAMTNSFTLLNTPTTGTVVSQVFRGIGQDSGLTAYAYQFHVNNVIDNTGQPASLYSAAIAFGGLPVPINLGTGQPSAAYVVTGGQIGGIDATGAPPGAPTPSSIAFVPGPSPYAHNSLTLQYLDPIASAGPIGPGSTSATLVVITNNANVATPFVSIQNADPQNGYPRAYAPTGGEIPPVPAPEPAAVLGWLGAIGAVLAYRGRLRSSGRS